ncbi:MAG: FAD-binding protein [Actinobacteria bacterium]|nr:FAD-binding protein [Actinomycetota bacterium]
MGGRSQGMVTGRLWVNWGQNQSCRPEHVAYPRSPDEIAALVKTAAGAGRTVKVIGSGHSFTGIALTDGLMLSLRHCDRILEVDHSTGLVKVEAGITLASLNRELAAIGLAIENLGDIEYQSVAGAISTSTHGTGAKFHSIPSQVEAMELILADGSTLNISRASDPDLLHSAQVGLGALGVIATVTLRCVPAFNLYSEERPWKLNEVLEQIDDLVDSNEHVDFYWYPHSDVAQTFIHNRTNESARPRHRLKAYYEDVLMENRMFNLVNWVGSLNQTWIPSLSGFTASQIGRARITDRSDRVFTNPRTVRFVEMEYAIPRSHAIAALRSVKELIEKKAFKIGFPIEMRFLGPDDAFLGTAYGRDTAYIAVHVYYRLAYESFFREVEAVMKEMEGRPHWGKMHYRTAHDLRPLYPQWDRFLDVRDRLDPERVFSNEYLERVLGP